MKKKILTLSLLVLTPSIAMAAINTTFFDDLISSLIGVLNGLVPLFIALAVVYFLWGVLQFVSSGDDAEARKQGQARMVHGIIAIFVMVSLWGLINILVEAFDLTPTVIEPPVVDPLIP